MGFLSNIFRGKLADLVTCVVSKSQDGMWETEFVDYDAADNFTDPSLGNLTDKVSAAVAKHYRDSTAAETAELQYAIYPGEQGKDIIAILRITKSAEGFMARDIQGSDLTISGTSLEELVSKAMSHFSDPSQVMLQWILPIRELQ